MFELPLFPLNTVLFPGMPLVLHIFEERYKEMIQHCLAAKEPFGVVLIRKGTEALGPLAEPYSIGCTAHITEIEPLEDGRMNIAALGKDRFRIHSLDQDKPYLVGQVKICTLDNQHTADLAAGSKDLQAWLQRYIEVLAQVGNITIEAERFPNDPIALAYFGAILLQIPATEKQSILEIEDAADLLPYLDAVFRREVPLLQALVRQATVQKGPFSTN